VTDEQMVAAYRSGMNLRDLAAKAGAGHRIVRRRLVAAGEPLRRPGRQFGRGRQLTGAEVKAMAAAYVTGSTLDGLAARYDIHRETVRHWLTNAGVQIRPQGSRPNSVYVKARAR
jgi:hypothetical protein